MPRHALILGLALLALAAGPAAAQIQTNVEVDVPTQPPPFPPGVEAYFPVIVRYTWGTGGQLAPRPTTIRLSVLEQPSWLEARFNPTELTVDTKNISYSGVYFKEVNLTIAVSRASPAFDTGLIRVRVEAVANPPLDAAARDREFDVVAGFLPLVQARLVDTPTNGTIAVKGGFDEHVAVEVTNLGNGPLRVAVEATRTPAESKWQPVEVVLGTNEGERSRIVQLPVRTPWRVSYSFPTEITVTPTHATRGVAGQPIDLNFTLRSESLVPIPAGGGLLVPLGLAAVAVAVGRRRSATPSVDRPETL